ncbi:MAG: hypothetical protein ABJA64_01905, partial [Candidatus Saccharibacteria bacterium]
TSHTGFTIIELLIVIATTSVLFIIANSYSASAQKQTRDNERQSDASVIMDKIEAYYTKNNTYPSVDKLNPTTSTSRLPNYDAVKTTLPGITDDDLNGPSDYNFIALSCAVDECMLSSDASLTKPKQYIYFSNKSGEKVSNLRFDSVGAMWGCKLTTSSISPSAVIAWRSEMTGKWTFKKAKHGDVTISKYGHGPITPTVCAFS